MKFPTAFCFSILSLSSLGVGEMVYCWAAHPYRTPATLRVHWHHQAQFAGFYLAKDKGFYRDEDIDLKIVGGGPQVHVPEKVAEGEDTFGIATGSQVLEAYSKQKNIKAIGTVFGKSLACFMVRKDSKIFGPTDFSSKKVAVYHKFDTEAIYLELLRITGVDRNTIIEVPAETVDQFWNGMVDVWPSYVSNEPLDQRRQKTPIRLIQPSQFGIQSYSDTIIVSECTLHDQPELVKGFIRASEKGWLLASQDPTAAVSAVLGYVEGRGKDPAVVEHETLMMQTLSGDYIRANHPFEMNREVWQAMTKMNRAGEPLPADYIDRLCDFEISGGVRSWQKPTLAGFGRLFARAQYPSVPVSKLMRLQEPLER